MHEGVVYKHCSERCKSLHFGNPSEVPFQSDLVYHKVNRPLIDTILLQTTKVASTEISSNTILSIQLCLSYNHPRIPSDVPYALVQIRTTTKSIFLSFFIALDMSPGEPLWYATFPEQLNVIDNIRRSGIVQEALQLSLMMNGISDLPSLLLKATTTP